MIEDNPTSLGYWGDPSLSKKISTKGRALKQVVKLLKELKEAKSSGNIETLEDAIALIPNLISYSATSPSTEYILLKVIDYSNAVLYAPGSAPEEIINLPWSDYGFVPTSLLNFYVQYCETTVPKTATYSISLGYPAMVKYKNTWYYRNNLPELELGENIIVVLTSPLSVEGKLDYFNLRVQAGKRVVTIYTSN